jgi:CubicO group peptidase (beta-lactamase class C family)
MRREFLKRRSAAIPGAPIVLAALSVFLTACDHQPKSPTRGAEADALKALSVRADKLAHDDEFSGAVLVARDGHVLFSRAYGLADRKRRIPNTVQTRFRIGSMNKMFTAVAILQLVEAGKVKLTAPLSTYLPNYPTREVATRVTIRQLARVRARGNDQQRTLPEDQPVPDRSIGYMKPAGTTAWVPNTETLPYRATSAGGGYSTVEDLARFARALLSHELLNPAFAELLITGKVEAGHGIRYAYGFEDARDPGGNGWVGKAGVAPGMNGDLRIYPKSGYVVAVLANIDAPAAQRISEYLDARLPTKR